MRTKAKYNEFLGVRAKLIDWMIEVFEAFSDTGSNEYTFFRAVFILDCLINEDRIADEDHLHIYGVAAINIASKLLDYKPITVEDCYTKILQGCYERGEILDRINKMLNYLNFEINTPTWLEYLDKLIFDVFGDYRSNVSIFNIRQVALFVLHVLIYDVRSYTNQPRVVVAIALLYSVNAHYMEWEKSCNKNNALEIMNGRNNKEQIIESISKKAIIPIPMLNSHLRELYGFMGKVKDKMVGVDCEFDHLQKLFNINT